jgi:hypothetical protein
VLYGLAGTAGACENAQTRVAARTAEVLFMWDLWKYVSPRDLWLLAGGLVLGIPLVIMYLIARRRKTKKKGKAKNKD